ncbi:hypothetical protein AB837_00360 [bacterium AB1]|nr:hypothetical protein AB837_00360 [bacterium AB1]
MPDSGFEGLLANQNNDSIQCLRSALDYSIKEDSNIKVVRLIGKNNSDILSKELQIDHSKFLEKCLSKQYAESLKKQANLFLTNIKDVTHPNYEKNLLLLDDIVSSSGSKVIYFYVIGVFSENDVIQSNTMRNLMTLLLLYTDVYNNSQTLENHSFVSNYIVHTSLMSGEDHSNYLPYDVFHNNYFFSGIHYLFSVMNCYIYRERKLYVSCEYFSNIVKDFIFHTSKKVKINHNIIKEMEKKYMGIGRKSLLERFFSIFYS